MGLRDCATWDRDNITWGGQGVSCGVRVKMAGKVVKGTVNFYSKPTNNNLRTSSASQPANKKQEYVKSVDKKVEKKDDEKKRDTSKVKWYSCNKEGHFTKDCKKANVRDYEYYKTNMLLAKKDKDEQVILAEDHARMESSSDSDQVINANMVFMAQIEKVLSDSEPSSSSADDKISEVSYSLSESESESKYETLEYYDNTAAYGLFLNDNGDQEIFHGCENFPENLIESQINHNESGVGHNDSEGIDKLIRKFNKNIAKCLKCIEKANQQNKDFKNQNKDLQDKYAKDLRPTLYDERVNNLGYTSMFLTHSDEALEIEKFKRTRENKIEFAYDYGNMNASYVNEKINLSDYYFQEIINLDFDKIDSPFQQTSSLKPYVLNVILENIIIDLEGQVDNPNVIAPAMFKLSVSQIISPISVTKTTCASNSVENLETLSSVRRPKPSGVMWMKKRSSNTVKADLSSVNHSILNKNVMRYSRKNLMACNNSDTRSAFDCNNARMNASVDVNDCLFLMM
nr:hypothetical protein [Tanacetum cinerariifolium]